MDRAFRIEPGGIQSLLELPTDQWVALEADLLVAGFTLSDIPTRVSWRALYAMVRHTRPESAFYAVLSDEDTQWPRSDQLTAALIDSIRDLTWMYQCAHSDSPPARPQPFPRPGVEAVPDGADHYGSEPIAADDFEAWWQMGGG